MTKHSGENIAQPGEDGPFPSFELISTGAMAIHGSLPAIARLGVRYALWFFYLAITSSFLCFTIIELHPAILEFIKPQRVAYYAAKDTYVADDKLMFRRRSTYYDRFFSQSPAITGGDQFDYVPAAYLGLIKKWHSHAQGRTEDGFRRNSSKAPFDVVMVGDSFFEIGESEGATLAELLKDRTRLNVMNLGFAWYGPYQYLELIKRYAAPMKPRVIVVGLFAGNDMHDLNGYDEWLKTGRFGDQNRSFPFRYYAAMRDILRVLRSDVSAALAGARSWMHRLPAGQDARSAVPDPAPRADSYDINAIHTPPYARGWHPRFGFAEIESQEVPMVFSYWNVPASVSQLLQFQQWKNFERIAATIATFEERLNTRIVWLVIPAKIQIYGRQAELSNKSDPGFRRLVADQRKFETNFRDAFKVIAEKHRLEYLDLLPAFQQLADKCILYYPTDSHWSIHGRLVAVSLLSELLASERGKPVLFDPAKVSAEQCGRVRDYYNLSE